MSIELTEPLQRALDAQQGEPLRVVDPRTNAVYVLVRAEVYEQLRPAAPSLTAEAEEELPIPEGIRRSKEAFFRDLPELLHNPRYEGWWVLYHGEERIVMGRDSRVLDREIHRRGLKCEEYYIGTIRVHEPEPEEIEHSFYEFDDEEGDELTGPSA